MMGFIDFRLIPRGVFQGKFAQKKPLLDTVRVVNFTRRIHEIFVKTDYNDAEFSSAVLLQRKVEKSIKIGLLFFLQCQL